MSYLMLADGNDINDFYVSVPTQDGGVVRVREDYFDRFPDAEYMYIMDQLDGVDGVSGIFSKSRERKDQRRAERKQKKSSHTTNKGNRKANRKQRQTNFFDKIVGTVKSFAPGQTDSSGSSGYGPDDTLPSSYGSTKKLNVGFNVDNNTPDDSTPWYENPLYIVGGLVVVGGIVYFATRKHSTK